MNERIEDLLGRILAELEAINRRADEAGREVAQRQAQQDKLIQAAMGALPPDLRQIYTGGQDGN